MINKKILHVGPFFEGSTVVHRHNGLLTNFTTCRIFNTNKYLPTFRRGFHSLWRKLKWGPPIFRLNYDLTQDVIDFKPDFIFFEKSIFLFPKTLKYFKDNNITLIHFSTDDQFNPKNQTKNYLKSISLYDIHITTKSYNVNELYRSGAKMVFFVNNATDNNTFKPIDDLKLISQYTCDVGFIGTWEKERAESILFLAENGIKVRVWGPGWSHKKELIHHNIILEKKYIQGNEYVFSINATKINLNFLRKENRDLQTTRSIEIPACKGFMLAEYSNEHANLFEEGVEAEYFKNNLDLLNKVKFYLTNESNRIEISNNGYNRCYRSNYFYSKQYELLFNQILTH